MPALRLVHALLPVLSRAGNIVLVVVNIACLSGCSSLRSPSPPGRTEFPAFLLHRVDRQARAVLASANKSQSTDVLFLGKKPDFVLKNYTVGISGGEFMSAPYWQFTFSHQGAIPVLGFPKTFVLWMNALGDCSVVGPGGPWLGGADPPVSEDQ